MQKRINMSLHKVAQDVVDTTVTLTGSGAVIAGIADIIHLGISTLVGVATIIFLYYRIEKLRHEKKQRGKDDGEV
jgi:hypothetical protein